MQQTFPCPKCGAQIPVGQHFCSACSERFEYRCGNCGAATETISGFCTNCGEKLHRQTQLTEPQAKRATKTHTKEKPERERPTPQPIGQVGRYLIFIAIIIFIGAALYAVGTSSPGETSNWLGSFIFGGKSPPSVPPSTPPSTPPTIDAQQTPTPATDLPRYSANQVIAVAKRLSPACRAPTQRTG